MTWRTWEPVKWLFTLLSRQLMRPWSKLSTVHQDLRYFTGRLPYEALSGHPFSLRAWGGNLCPLYGRRGSNLCALPGLKSLNNVLCRSAHSNSGAQPSRPMNDKWIHYFRSHVPLTIQLHLPKVIPFLLGAGRHSRWWRWRRYFPATPVYSSSTD